MYSETGRNPKMIQTDFSTIDPRIRLRWRTSHLDTFIRDPFSFALYSMGWKQKIQSGHIIFGDIYNRAEQDIMRAWVDGDKSEETLIAITDRARLEALQRNLDLAPVMLAHRTKISTPNLIRAIVAYWDRFIDTDTITLHPDLRAAETVYELELPLRSSTGEPYILIGHLDNLCLTKNGGIVPLERKTTCGRASEFYMRNLACSIQVKCYQLIADHAKTQFGVVGGVLAHVIELGTTYTDFQRMSLTVSRDKIRAFEDHIYTFLSWHDVLATQDRLSMNGIASGRCPINWPGLLSKDWEDMPNQFKELALKSPELIPGELEMHFVKE